ncbi:hypothetical protein MTQ00_10670 [Chryseobacterium sp. B21-037]|uniref:hypothetical protein n=1 Tax=Chryseobacterium sp. B21-037 TaxID=2926038 RepID=UPI00235999A9|nr:hypothetical protein [Chryseobacterium sp. B21-037]MDC8105003.1 hypothetical protein [Chryseobacterium sp. B21-037]
MDWFNYLKEQDFFNPENNPSPIQVSDGYQIPSWEVLDYLIAISEKLKYSENLELIPEILEIVKNISEHPVDNYHTWYKLIKILSLIPNDYVTDEFLDFIPVYVTSRFDTLLQTAEITDSLLPKFLKEDKNSEDIEKAERIISHLFEVRCFDSLEQLETIATLRYGSPFYLYKINHAFHDEQILSKIINICSSKPLYKLIDQINILLRDNVIVAEGVTNELNYTFKFYRVYQEMIFTLERSSNDEKELLDRIVINDYLKLDVDWFNHFLTDIFTKHSIELQIYNDLHEKLSFALWNDFSSLVGYEGFKDLEQDSHFHNVTLGVFSYILREWLVGLIEVNPERLKDVLKDFIYKNELNLPYFKRLLLYVVAQDWDSLKYIFWNLVDKEDNINLFSSFSYRLELYYMLSKVSKNLNTQEQELINNIIEKGPVGKRHYSSSKEEWQHRWLDALQENEFFNSKYKALEEKYNVINDYSEEGKFVVRVGHITPFTKEEILSMQIEDIVHNIENFSSKGGWDNPTVEGFAEVIKEAIEEEPDKFSNCINLFLNVKYIYVNEILSAFSNAWKANKFFNWENVLNFSFRYITAPSFLDHSNQMNDDFRVNKDWIYGAISMLITNGTQNESHSISNELLPICKEILFHIFQQLPESDFKISDDTDFIMYSLNSTQGQLMAALLNYSLKLARNKGSENELNRWDDDVRNIFDESFDKFIDSFVLIGKHIPQFMYLDEEWLREKLLFLNNVEGVKWLAFMNGLTFGKPLNIVYYNILYPSYQRAVDSNISIIRYNHGILRHLLAYYFWDYEENFEKTLLYKILQNSNVDILQNMIQLLVKQKAILRDDIPNKEILVQKILKIWSLINASLELISKDLKSFDRIVYLTDFIEKLTDENVVLVEQNLLKFHNDINNIHFIGALSNWMNNSSPELIGRLVSIMNIKYVHEKQPLIDLVTFLYETGQNSVGNHVVNKLTMEGYDFLKPIYLRFNQ